MSEKITHFGLTVTLNEFGPHISKEYWLSGSRNNTVTRTGPYSQAWIDAQLEKASYNYDLNMAYYAALDRKEFEAALAEVLEAYPDFYEIHDLNAPECTGGGCYIMVLDEFKQFYIGSTERPLKVRIRQHWNNRKNLDRLIFGDVKSSGLSIDAFRVLDTTRIFWAPGLTHVDEAEALLGNFGSKFLCNRVVDEKDPLLLPFFLTHTM